MIQCVKCHTRYGGFVWEAETGEHYCMDCVPDRLIEFHEKEPNNKEKDRQQ